MLIKDNERKDTVKLGYPISQLMEKLIRMNQTKLLNMTDEKLCDKELWDYAISQHQFLIQEFGLGIVGIGALLWAYGSFVSVVDPNTVFLRNLIAWIGLGGSFILWVHIYGTVKEFDSVIEEIGKTSPEFIKRFSEARSWRLKGANRIVYTPVSRLMTYFAGLVTWIWFSIILLNSNLVQQQTMLLASVGVLIFAVGVLIYHKIKLLRKKI